jgi:hypothetical protein
MGTGSVWPIILCRERAVVNAVMNPRGSYKAGNFLT